MLVYAKETMHNHIKGIVNEGYIVFAYYRNTGNLMFLS